MNKTNVIISLFVSILLVGNTYALDLGTSQYMNVTGTNLFSGTTANVLNSTGGINTLTSGTGNTDYTSGLTNIGTGGLNSNQSGSVTEITMMTEIKSDIIVESGASLIIGTNVDIKGYKIILNNAQSLTLGVNASAEYISGSTAEFTLKTNAEVKNAILDVSGATVFETNANIDKINLKTNSLSMDVNTDINDGIIYVFGDFKGGVNSGFKGKMTVFGDSSMDVNTDFSGRYCSLGKVKLGVNTSVVTYDFKGLFGNIDPILDYKLLDSENDFIDLKAISEDFDTKFKDVMIKIDDLNAQIKDNQAKLKTAKETDKAGLSTKIDGLMATKAETKEKFKTDLNKVFDVIKVFIDSNPANANLFSNVQKMYSLAIDNENADGIFNICNNAEVSGDANSYYEKAGKVVYKDETFARKNVILEKQEATLVKSIAGMKDEKIALIESKVDVLIEKYLKKPGSTAKDQKNVNLLLDLKDLLEDGLLY